MIFGTGICDVYKVAGNIQRVVQLVNCLPHVKYDKFRELTGDAYCIYLCRIG